MSGGFLDYLEDFNSNSKVPKKQPMKVQPKKEVVTSKVLCLNVEVRTVDGAQLVIEKLQEWINKQNGVNESKKVEKKVHESSKKPEYKIPPKKVIKSQIHEARSRAMDILDGLPDEIFIPEVMLQQEGINTLNQINIPEHNLNTTAGHASALL